MTIALGMVCADGVLVASDSMGSSGMIARQVTKVYALESQPVIWARAGSDFVTERIQRVVKLKDLGDPGWSLRDLSDEVVAAVRDAYGVPVAPPNEKEQFDHSTELLLLAWSDGPAMLHVPADLATVDCTERARATIGSGHDAASAAGAALSHYSGNTEGISLAKGCLIAYRLVSAVCQVSSWGVGPPVQIAVADSDGARVLAQAELDELDLSVERWLASEREFFLGEARHRGAEPVEIPRIGDNAEASAS